MVCDHRIDDIVAQRFEPGQGARLVEAHEATVPHHVGGEDRDQLAFDLWCLVHDLHDREIGRRGYGKGCLARSSQVRLISGSGSYLVAGQARCPSGPSATAPHEHHAARAGLSAGARWRGIR